MSHRSPTPARALLAAALLGTALGTAGCGDGGRRPPNVILVSIDTLRYDHCGFNGYERDTTPFLDEFSAQCVAFDRAYTTMSFTLIAHMSMLTGLYPSQHGVTEGFLGLNPSVPTLAQRLQQEGWTTAGVHFPGWLDPRFGFGRGFEFYRPAESAAEAEAELERATAGFRTDHPFFLFIHLFDVHTGDMNRPGSTMYDPPPPYDSMWVPDARERLAGIDAMEWWEEPQDPTAEQHEAVVALYDGGIRHVDDRLRAWFAEWEQRGLLENTLVIVTSDHGEGLRQRDPYYGGHGEFQEEGLRIPVLVRFPDGAHAGTRVDTVTSLVDLVPTVLDELDLDDDPRLPGRHLVDEPRPPGEWVFAAKTRESAAVNRDRKLLFDREGPTRLYRLDEDPGEEAPPPTEAQRPAFLAAARPVLDDVLAQAAGLHRFEPALSLSDLDDESKARLEALGYGGEVGK